MTDVASLVELLALRGGYVRVSNNLTGNACGVAGTGWVVPTRGPVGRARSLTRGAPKFATLIFHQVRDRRRFPRTYMGGTLSFVASYPDG